MSSKEIGIEEARKDLGGRADAAHHYGEITYLTKYGRRHAAIVPLDRITQEPAMEAVRIADARVDEILAALNAHNDEHRAHRADDPFCGCNPFEDVIYALPEYDGVATSQRFPEHEEAFVLADGTEVESQHDGSWEATRPESL